jgi:hypothetical protein
MKNVGSVNEKKTFNYRKGKHYFQRIEQKKSFGLILVTDFTKIVTSVPF